jgi:hypothetical protein
MNAPFSVPRKKLAAICFAAVALLFASVAAAPGAQAVGTIHGCNFGYFCIYPQNAGWNGDHPSLQFYSYGAHNLTNQLGNHVVFNNQSGTANGYLCLGYAGTGGWTFGYPQHSSNTVNLTPINSIELTPNIDKNPCRL